MVAPRTWQETRNRDRPMMAGPGGIAFVSRLLDGLRASRRAVARVTVEAVVSGREDLDVRRRGAGDAGGVGVQVVIRHGYLDRRGSRRTLGKDPIPVVGELIMH